MKVLVLFSFAALLGTSLADLQTEEIQVPDVAGGSGIPTESRKLVKQLIEVYETMSQNSLQSRPKPTGDNLIAGSKASTETVAGSAEQNVKSRMEEDIAQIEAAFKTAVGPSYDGMSNRKLWKELTKKQKLLATVKVQLQHALNTKQERLNKLHGKPSKHNIPSTELSNTILSHIDEIVAYRPENLNL